MQERQTMSYAEYCLPVIKVDERLVFYKRVASVNYYKVVKVTADGLFVSQRTIT